MSDAVVLVGTVEERIPITDTLPYDGKNACGGKVCGAKKRNGSPCQMSAMPNGRCRLHGGMSPGGVSSPHFTHGGRSKYLKDLPSKLRAGYKDALNDESLLSLRDELAVLETRARELLRGMEATPPPPWAAMQSLAKQLKTGDESVKLAAAEAICSLSEKGADAARTYEMCWSKLLDVIDRKTKVAAAEWKRMTELNAVVTVDDAMMLIKAFMSAARETVTDSKMLQEFQRRVVGLLPAPKEYVS